MSNKKLFNQAKTILVGGVNSPVRSYSSVGGTPLFIEKGKGAIITDAEENEYIDYVGAFGPAIVGHGNNVVVEAVRKQALSGFGFGAPSRVENELAKMIIKNVPSIEMVRMTSSGTEAALTAIRLARGFTKRDIIIKFEGCYHGHVDSLLVNAGSGALTFGLASSEGIPDDVVSKTVVLPYNDTDLVEKSFQEMGQKIAAIIVEPIAGNMGCVLPDYSFLKCLREQTEQHGSLLIFDEVMTGFRVARGGAQELFGIDPDLTLLGKVIGGGLPVGAVGGPAKIMEYLTPLGSVYQAGTLSGNPISMASGVATLNLLDDPDQYKKLKTRTKELCEGLEQIAYQLGVPLKCNYTCGMFGIFFTDRDKITSLNDVTKCDVDFFKKFFHLMLANGINFAPSPYEAGFLSFAHEDKHIQLTLEAARRSLETLNK